MRAVVLFSGGVDSTVALAMALEKGRECFALSLNYGQKHCVELEYAKKIADHYGVKQKIIQLDPHAFGNSALLSNNPAEGENTYVPARNTIFLAYALGMAEEINAGEIYTGPNAADFENYPDCRPDYIQAMQNVANLATKQGSEGNPPKIITPLLHMNKTEIFKEGNRLGIPFDLTFSCYHPIDGKACEKCDACTLRLGGFQALRESLS